MKPFTKQFIFIIIGLAIIASGVFVAVAVNNRGNAPVAWWKFDEGYGSTAFDAAGANDGTITNAAWRNEPDCKSGKCLYFDGTGDYVDAGNGASLDITGDITIESWMYLKAFIDASGLGSRIVSKRSAGTGYEFFAANDAGNKRLGVVASEISYYSNANVIAEGQWYHVAVARSSGTASFYVNGVFAGSISIPTIISSTASLFIGDQAGGGRPFNGLIDDVRIYDYARTASQIKADYLAGAGGRGAAVKVGSLQESRQASEGLVGHWKMDETSWTVDCFTDTVMDSSGAGKHGDACPNAGGLAPAAGKYGNAGTFDGTEDYVKIPDIDF